MSVVTTKHRVVPMSSKKQAHVHSCRYDDDTISDASTADLMGEADAALSVTPNEIKTVDLSAYLVPDGELYPHSAVKSTPPSLETQDTALDEDDRELSDLLDYLNDLGFDSPRSVNNVLEARHSHRQTPNPRGSADAAAAAPMTSNRNVATQTPAQRGKIFRDRSNQTWPVGAKKIFQSSESPRQQSTVEESARKRHVSLGSETPMSSNLQAQPDLLSNKGCNEEHGNNRSELELDLSLEELLEETTDKMLSPRTVWQFSEEEWERLEKVQRMAEILLREAEHERDSARRWAQSVRESVQQWVEEQRALMEEARVYSSDVVQLKATCEALNRLQLEMDEVTSHHDKVKQTLKVVIQRQADTIKVLEAKLHDKAEASAPTLKSPNQSTMRSDLHTPIKSMRAPRISLSPHVGRERDKRPISKVPYPISEFDPVTPTKHDCLLNSVPSPVSMTITPRTQRARTTLADGGKLVVYRNGTEKETRPDGTCVIRFPNGDVRCTLGSKASIGIVAYYHAKEKVIVWCC